MHSHYKNKKVIITGGAGFIGSHLAERLVRLGAQVIALDDLSAGKEKNIKFLYDYDNFQFVKKSVTDKDGMDALFEGTYAVFHNAASKKNICLIDPQKDLIVNGGGTLNLLEFAAKHKTERFIHASTGSVYGEPTIFPTTEDHPLKPVSYYGVSKLAGERYVDVFHHLYGLNTTILRYFHVYGPRQESNEFGGVVSIFIRNALNNETLFVNGDGDQMRSFTYVKDLVEVNLNAGINPIAIGKVYNAASGIKVSINELAAFILKCIKTNSKIVHNDPLIGDIKYFDLSNEAVKKDLGVDFNTDFWGTLENTLEEFISSIK